MRQCCSLLRDVISAIGLLALIVPAGHAAEPPPLDFIREVRPIFDAKCRVCHGSMTQSGGVRFDMQADVAAGGYSQRPLLGGTLATNEIYRRVSSDDPTYRMPKGEPPLTPDEIATLRRWVQAGTPWSDEPVAPPRLDPGSDWLNLAAWTAWSERCVAEIPGLLAWLLAMLLLQLILLWIIRHKRAFREGQSWTQEPRGARYRWVQSIGVTQYGLVALTMSLLLAIQINVGLQRRVSRLDQTLMARQSAAGPAKIWNTFTIYGDPPLPHRPEHPPRLAGEYYRGNCERSPNLFNGGNYRTATLRVSFVDEQGQKLDYGQKLNPGPLFIRFELERAKGTTPELFGNNIAKGVFLTEQVLKDNWTAITRPVERMQVVQPDWLWEARFPVPSIDQQMSEQSLTGLIYVYQGTLQDQRARGTLHYGIRYRLHLQDGVLQSDSEVWLGSLFWSSVLINPDDRKIPFDEWFDHQPIPEITGKNSTDPTLLGIPEHRWKGTLQD